MIVPRQDATFDLELNDGKFQSAVLCRQLLRWWQFHGRKDASLKPWMFTADGRWPKADEDLDPYPVWVAEVMLQQTQLQVVLPYWRRWMEAFPRLEALAAASEQQVLLL